MSATGDLRPSHDWQKVVLFVLTVAGAIYAFGDKIFVVGRQTVTADRVERVETKINQMAVEQERTKLQSEMAAAAALRVENKVDDINAYLRRLDITGHKR